MVYMLDSGLTGPDLRPGGGQRVPGQDTLLSQSASLRLGRYR